MNIRQELKILDVKLQELRQEYFKNNKREQAEYLDSTYNRLQSSFISLKSEIEATSSYFTNLLEEKK